MNLVLASRGGFDNPKSWSGTPYILKHELEKLLGYNLATFDWQIDRGILRSYYATYNKFFFNWGTSRDPLLHPLFKRKIVAVLGKETKEKKWVLFVSDYCIPENISDKFLYAAYFDAFLIELLNHIEDKRPGRDKFIRYYEKYNRLYLERMGVIFTQNEWTRQSLIKHYGMTPEKIHNIGFGINVRPLLGEKSYDEDLLLIVLRKGTEKYKGLFLLLEAFRLIKTSYATARLAVVGTDVGQNQPGVTCYFNQPRSITEELFRKATLYVMPALHEPNGITYLEALANKTPIVGLNRFAFPEFSGYGKWGFVVKEENASGLAEVIIGALKDKGRLNIMGTNGQKFVTERYQWSLVADKIVSTMQEYDIKDTALNA